MPSHIPKVAQNIDDWKIDFGWHGVNDDLRVSQIKNLDPTAAVLSQFDYQYDDAGQITQWKQWHSGLGGANARRHVFGYDDADQLLTDTVRDDLTDAVLKTYGYGYDAAGNRTSEQDGAVNKSWGVDEVGGVAYQTGFNQLTSQGGGLVRVVGSVSAGASVTVNGQSVAVDGANQWQADVPSGVSVPVVATETNPTVGTNPQVTAKTLTAHAALKTLAYDLNGNLTDDGGTRTFQWDAADRLVAIDYTGTSPAERTEMSYDGLSRRTKIVEKVNGAVVSEKRFVWDGLAIAEERDASNAVTRRYYGGNGEEIAGVPYLYLRDHLGSVRELVSTSGTVAARYDYDPYGKRTKLSGTADTSAGYTGHYYHAKSGLHLAPYRAYDAGLGRWISRDPIGEAGGLNFYGYVKNRSTSRIDPLGLADVTIELALDNLDSLDQWLESNPSTFSSAKEMAEKAKSKLKSGDRIKVLSLNGHGGGEGVGLILLGSNSQIYGNRASSDVVSALSGLAPLMSPDGVLLLNQCYTASSPEGILGLQYLARLLNVPVVGKKGAYNPWDMFGDGYVIVLPDGKVFEKGGGGADSGSDLGCK